MSAPVLLRTALVCGAVLVGAVPAAAQDNRSTYVDLSADLGYSSNPFFSIEDDTGSAFGRVSAYGVHAWRSERSETALSAYLENSAYFRRHGNKPLFDLNARTSHQTSETVRVFGGVSFSGDFGGQLGTRFVSIPTFPVAPTTPQAPASAPGAGSPSPVTAPVVTPVALPPPVTIVDPELLSLTGRQYRLAGQGGVVIRPNARDIWTVSGGVQRLFYTRNADDMNYTLYSLTGSYDRQLNERLTVGFRTSLQRSNYSQGGSTTLINPQVTAGLRLAEAWEASAALGLIYSRQDFDGRDDDAVGLSGDASVCRNFESSRLCGRVSRYQQNTIGADLLTTTSAGADYSYRIDQNQSLQLSGSIVRYSGQRVLDRNVTSNYFVTSGSYNRRISDRLSGGVNASVRKLSQFGPDPNVDAGGSVFLRYRLGDLQ